MGCWRRPLRGDPAFTRRRVPFLAVAGLLLGAHAMAQESSGFELTEQAFNAGGHPADGAVLRSASFTVTLSVIGEGVAPNGMRGDTFELDSGFAAAYLPPREVAGACGSVGAPCLRFDDAETLTWPGERSAGVYNLYRDTHRDLVDQCGQPALPGTTATDRGKPSPGAVFFYLVTVRNRLGVEGSKGLHSDGTERPNPGPCP